MKSEGGYLLGAFLGNFFPVLILTRLVNYITVRNVSNRKTAYILSAVLVVVFYILIGNALVDNEKKFASITFMVVLSGILCLIYDYRRLETGTGIAQWLHIRSEVRPNDLQNILESAKNGNPEAQLNVAAMFYEGKGVAKDLEKAFVWWQEAAEQGYAEAEFKLGLMYEQGECVPKNLVMAAEWYRKSADLGYAKAQYKLGLMYEQGEAVPKDLAKAVELWREAAEQGLDEARFQLRSM